VDAAELKIGKQSRDPEDDYVLDIPCIHFDLQAHELRRAAQQLTRRCPPSTSKAHKFWHDFRAHTASKQSGYQI
jgi:hypothetical protein